MKNINEIAIKFEEKYWHGGIADYIIDGEKVSQKAGDEIISYITKALHTQQDDFEKMIGEDRKNDGTEYESTSTNIEKIGYNQAKAEIRSNLQKYAK